MFPKTVLSAALVAACGVSTSLAWAAKPVGPGALGSCVQSVLNGPERQGLWVYGHQFNCKPMARVKAQGRGSTLVWTVSGRLSHVLRLRPDDQVSYRFVVQTGRITGLKIDIDRGGVGKWLGVSNTQIYQGVSKSFTDVEKFAVDTGRFLSGLGKKGPWEDAASAIVGEVAVAMARRHVAAARAQPAPPRPASSVVRPASPTVRDHRK